MNDINTITFTGRAVAAPTNVNDGKIAKFSVAINRSFRTEDGRFEDAVSFVDVVAFNGIAALLLRKLKKADRVMVTGRLVQERWKDAATGDNRSRLVVVATQVAGEFVFRPTNEPGPDDEPAPDNDPQLAIVA